MKTDTIVGHIFLNEKGQYLKIQDTLTLIGPKAEASFVIEIDKADVFSPMYLALVQRRILLKGVPFENLTKIPAELVISRSVRIIKGE